MDKTTHTRYKAALASMREGDLQAVVRQCDRKDVSSLPLFKALKAMALDRSGYREEAMALCLEALRPVGGRVVTSPRVLTLTAKVMRRSGDESKVREAYEAALQATPDSEHLGKEVALSLARGEEWRKFQAAAMRLNKTTGKPLYALWAAWAIHLTTSSPTAEGRGPAPLPLTGGGRRFFCDTPSDTRPLALAQTLLTRVLDALPPHTRDSESLGLLFHSLVRAGKPGDAYRALHGKYSFCGGGGVTGDSGDSGAGGSTKVQGAAAVEVAAPPLPVVAPSSGGGGGGKKGKESSKKGGGSGGSKQKQKQKDEEEDEFLNELASKVGEMSVEGVGEEGEGEGEGGEEEDDVGGIYATFPFADGKGGRGVVPSHFQPVDTLRYSAYLLTLAAVGTGGGSDGGAECRKSDSNTSTSTSTSSTSSTSNPGTGSVVSVGSWEAAMEAYGELLTAIDPQDWAYHSGLAYCWARSVCRRLEGGGEGVSDLVGSVLTPLAPVTPSVVTGIPAVDEGVLGGSSGGGGGGGVGGGVTRTRGSALSLIQLQAVRCEILTRLCGSSLAPSSSSSSSTSLGSCLTASLAAYVALVEGYVAERSHLPCCFTDLEPFLLPLLPPDAPHPSSSSSSSSSSPSSSLAAFLAPSPSILSMPFAPIAEVGSSSDTAPLTPLFRWSFTVPPLAQASLLATLQALRSNNRPTEGLRNDVLCVLAAAKTTCVEAAERAVAAAAAAAAAAGAGAAAVVAPVEAEKVVVVEEEEEEQYSLSVGVKKGGGKGGGKGGSKGGGGKGGGGKGGAGSHPTAAAAAAAAASPPSTTTATTTTTTTTTTTPSYPTMESILSSPLPVKKFDKGKLDPSDPHGVRGVLLPPSQLSFTPPQTATLSQARSTVRRYTTSLQLQRYLQPTITAAAAATASSSSLRDTVAEITASWACCLPLIVASQSSGGEKDVGEGDELLLLAAHALWDAAFDAIMLHGDADAPPPPPPTTPHSSAPAAAACTARGYLLESAALLHVGQNTSPYNAQFPLGLLAVYGWLGSSTGGVTAWNRCRIRHTLNDTLAHLGAPAAARLASPEAHKKTWCDASHGALYEAYMEVPPAVTQALAGGHVSAGVDLVRLRERVVWSGVAAVGRCAGVGLWLSGVGGGCKTMGEAMAVLKRAVGGAASSGAAVSGGPGVKPVLPHATLTLPPPSPTTYTWRDNSDRALRLSWTPPTGVARVALRGGVVAGMGMGMGESGEVVVPPHSSTPSVGGAGSSSAAAEGGGGEEDALTAFIHHALKAASPAAAPNPPSDTPTAAAAASAPVITRLATILRPWVGGRTGSTPELHLRSATTLAWYSLRHALYTTLLCASEGSTKEAVASWGRARHILSRVVHLPSSSSSSSSSSADLGGRSGESSGSGEVMVGTVLLGDCVGGGGTLPWIDAGLSETRWSVRQGAALALFGCFDAAVAACELVHGGGGKGGSSSSSSSSICERESLFEERVIQGVTGGTQALKDALGSVFSPTAYPIPSSTTPTPFHPALIAEGCMLLHTVCTLTNLALGVASLGVAMKLMGSAGGGSGGGGGGGGVGGATATPSIGMARVMGALEAGSERVCLGLSEGVAYLGEVKGGLGGGDKGLQGAVCGAWRAAHDALSPIVRGEGGGEWEWEGGGGAVVPPPATTTAPLPPVDLMPPGPGREWVEEGEKSRGVAVKRALNDALNAIGGGYVWSVEQLRMEGNSRLAFLSHIASRPAAAGKN